jgi:hypothetical protein
MAANPRRLSWSNDPMWDLVRHLSVALPVMLGAVIVLGGHDRMYSATGFRVLLEWAPFWMWGGSLVVAGLISMCPCWYVRNPAHIAIAVWCWLWWVAVVWGSISTGAALTAVVVYLVLAIGYTGSAVATVMDRGPNHG